MEDKNQKVATRSWLSDDPACTSYVAAQAGYVENDNITFTSDLVVKNGHVFDVLFELCDGGDCHYEDSYRIHTPDDLKIVKEAIKRVKETLDFLEQRISTEFPKYSDDTTD